MLAGSDTRGADELETPRRIYVPVDDLDAVLNRDRQGVLMPQEEFDELYQKASDVLKNQPNQPRTVVVSSGDYTASINGDRLELRGTVRFRQFVGDWYRVILPAGGLGVEQAVLDGEPARISRGKQHPNVLVLYSKETGEHTLEVTLSAPLVGVGSDRIADFELFNAPTGTFTFELPAGKFLVVDGLQLKRPAEADQPAEYEFPIGGRKRLQLRVTERQTPGPRRRSHLRKYCLRSPRRAGRSHLVCDDAAAGLRTDTRPACLHHPAGSGDHRRRVLRPGILGTWRR